MTETIDMNEEPLPPRPRRRVVTPAGILCGGVLIAALGFLGGVQVEKNAGGGTSPRAAGFQRTGQQQPQAQSDATVGQVSSVDGKAFYVVDQSGATVKVTTTKQSKVTRSAKAKASAIHPGDTVVVEGRTSASGTVVAGSVVATASNAQQGFIGGAAPGGG
jgi:hypothetical protein